MKFKVQPYMKPDEPKALDFYRVVSDWCTYQEGNRILKILQDNGIEVEIR